MNGWAPGTRPVDRAREIARTLYEALYRVAPYAADAIAEAAEAAEEYWLRPQPATYGLDDVITVQEAARLVGAPLSTVYTWVAADRAARIVPANDGVIRVRVRDVLEHYAYKARKDRFRKTAT